MKLPALSDLLTYQNSEILVRYESDYPDNKLTAAQAMRELMKFLWLAAKQQLAIKKNPEDDALNFKFTLHFEMSEIDDMWHCFLLFTSDYAQFCDRYFGVFMHHFPATSAEKEKAKHPSEAAALEVSHEKQLSYIYDHLGEETLRLWFAKCLEA
jgi:hypothetical protein